MRETLPVRFTSAREVVVDAVARGLPAARRQELNLQPEQIGSDPIRSASAAASK